MKDFLKGVIAVMLAATVLPLIALFFAEYTAPEPIPVISEQVKPPAVYSLITDVIVLDTVKGTTFTVPIEDYLLGCIAAHSADNPHDELIKAETVLFYTYILERRAAETLSPTLSLMGADISTDTSKYLPFWGVEGVEESETISQKALISEVLGSYISYDGKPIQPAFCVSSGGATIDSKTVLDIDCPYLMPVESQYDEGYTTVTVLSRAEVYARLSMSGNGYNLYTDSADWFANMECDNSGYVHSVALNETDRISGRELSHILNLPSSKFEVSYDQANEQFTFVNKGEGDPVGLSLYGANEMAHRGSSWQDIILHYYTDVEIITP